MNRSTASPFEHPEKEALVRAWIYPLSNPAFLHGVKDVLLSRASPIIIYRVWIFLRYSNLINKLKNQISFFDINLAFHIYTNITNMRLQGTSRDLKKI